MDSEILELDERMKAAGMIPLSEMLKGSPIGHFATNKGVVDLERFDEWLNMRYTEMMKMKARMLLAKREDDELYEWVLSHAAVFGEVVANFNAATKQ